MNLNSILFYQYYPDEIGVGVGRVMVGDEIKWYCF